MAAVANHNQGKEGRELWQKATEIYYHDQYSFKSFEALHVLSILYYERELCRISAGLVRDGKPGLSQSEEKEELERLRELLSGHGTQLLNTDNMLLLTVSLSSARALSDLEFILKREALLPKQYWGRKDIDETVPNQNEQRRIDDYCVEHHVYNLKPGLSLDIVRRMLHWLLPNGVKYDFAIATQMSRRSKEETELEQGILANHRELVEQRHWRRYADSKLVDSLSRLIVAILGGAALLIPMLIMTFRTKQSDKLITVCVSVTVFGVLFAMGTKASNQEVLAAAAAYAAVMVVYIGYATQTGPNN